MANISIEDHGVESYAYDLYEVNVNNHSILTMVTHMASMVGSWIAEIERIHRRRLQRLIVGLDVEWRPSFSRNRNPVAILQLCVGHRCLIFQIQQAECIPHSLVEFLGNESYTFVGVGIHKDVEKLEADYNLEVGGGVIDVAYLAADEYGEFGHLRNAGLKDLGRVVAGIEIDKPRDVTMSAWDTPRLSYRQVQYACLDAFLSFEIGRCLNAASFYYE